MDPFKLAIVTAALTMLGTEVAKGAASAVGQDVWGKVKSLFGWTTEPAAAQLPDGIAQRLLNNDVLLSQVVELLKRQPTGGASAMVGSINAKNVAVIDSNLGTVNFK